MRTSLIIFGVIFLVIGALLYFVPMQEFKANTTTTEGGDVDNRTSSASVSVPVGWAYASIIAGLILSILGFAIPNPHKRNDSKKDSYNKLVETKTHTQGGNNGHEKKITREKTERHNSR